MAQPEKGGVASEVVSTWTQPVGMEPLRLEAAIIRVMMTSMITFCETFSHAEAEPSMGISNYLMKQNQVWESVTT